MKTRHGRLPVLIGTILLLLAVCVFACAETGSGKKATVMIYMCGSDLESRHGQGTSTVTDINGIGYNKDEVSVILLQGGAKAWRRADADASMLNLLEAGKRRGGSIGTKPLSSMGDPATLTDFLAYCMENYPADRYYLVIWDHGGGPNEGVCFDELFQHDSLSVNELASALENSVFREKGLEIICFNTCLTGSIEYAAALAPYSRYMVATEDSMYGLDYAWLRDLDTEEDPKVIAGRIVEETYRLNAEQYAKNNGTEINSVAAVDLEKIYGVVDAMDPFFARVIPNVDQSGFVMVSRQRKDSATFGVTESGGGSDRDLADLGDLVTHLRDYAPEEADGLLSALKEAVVHKRSALDSCYGLTVYHPYSNKTAMKGYMEVHNGIPLSENYSAYIQQFAAILTGSALADWTGLTADASVSKVNRNLFTLALTEQQGEHLADAELYMLAKQEDGSFRFVSVNSSVRRDGNKLTGEYPGTALYAAADGKALSPALAYEVSDSGIWLIPAILTADGGQVDGLIRCAMDPETETLTPGGVMVREEGTGAYSIAYGYTFSDFTEISLPVVSRKETRKDNGVLQPFEDWEITAEESWTAPIDGSWEFAVLHDTIAPETLYAAFQVQDVQANRYTSEMAAAKGSRISSGDAVVSYDDLDLIQIGRFSVTLLQDNLLMTADITSLGETESIIRLNQLTLNGKASEGTAELYGSGPNWGLLSGETQSLMLTLPVKELPVSGVLTEAAFMLEITDAATGAELGTVPVAAELSLNLVP